MFTYNNGRLFIIAEELDPILLNVSTSQLEHYNLNELFDDAELLPYYIQNTTKRSLDIDMLAVEETPSEIIRIIKLAIT